MSSQPFNLEETIALLERTPAALKALLSGLPESWTRPNEGKGTWSAFEIVGHLIYGERTDWMPRARIILAKDESRTFEPFDRLGHVKEIAGKSVDNLLDEFASIRNKNLVDLRAMRLQAEDFRRRAQHPELGSVTLAELFATWAVHDLTHLHQLSRVMARQYEQAVGLWHVYLGVLQCHGHSS